MGFIHSHLAIEKNLVLSTFSGASQIFTLETLIFLQFTHSIKDIWDQQFQKQGNKRQVVIYYRAD